MIRRRSSRVQQTAYSLTESWLHSLAFFLVSLLGSIEAMTHFMATALPRRLTPINTSYARQNGGLASNLGAGC